MKEVLKFNTDDIQNMEPRERTEIATKLLSPFMAAGDFIENISLIMAMIMVTADTYENRQEVFCEIINEVSKLTLDEYELFHQQVNEVTEDGKNEED